MAQDFKDIVAEFFDKHGAKYPQLNLNDYLEICRAPFMFFRKAMEATDFPQINIKFFGKFVVWSGSIKKLLEVIEKNFIEGRINLEEYLKRTVHLKTYLNGYENQNPADSHRAETPD